MTLLDAPKYDAARSRRKSLIVQCSAGAVLLILVAWWLAASRPIDWPWNWNRYLFGRSAVNKFLVALEANDLPKAYGIWLNDKNWQQHPQQYATYPFARFQGDWSPTSPDNQFGPIRSHKIALAGRYGDGVLVAVFINGHKSTRVDDMLNLDYDPKTGALSFAPPGVGLYVAP